MNKCITYIICIVTVFFGACSKKNTKINNSDRPILTVSIDPLRNIVEQIAGDDFEVVTVLDKGANPETFDPSMSKQVTAANSDIYFMLGAFPFEIKIANAGKAMTINVAEGIEPIFGTHSHHQHHDGCIHEEDKDPHTWTSVPNIAIIAQNIALTLGRIYPEKADSINLRLSEFIVATDSLDTQIRNILSDTDKAFAIWHPSLSYFARDYGIDQIAVGQENKEVSPRRLKEIIEEARARNISVFFFQKEFDSRQAETIAEQIGARLITIDPLAYDWQTQIISIANELSK